MEEADSAMKLASAAFTLVDTKQVTGEGNSMMFGAYFNQYRHIDGHKVTFKKLPLMDRGVMADVSDPHPITGLPLESYNMYCIDNSTYEGQRNIQYVSEAGREEVNRVVPGMAAPPDGYNETLFASSDIDATSVEWMKTQGVQVMKPTNCFKLFNGIS